MVWVTDITYRLKVLSPCTHVDSYASYDNPADIYDGIGSSDYNDLGSVKVQVSNVPPPFVKVRMFISIVS